MRHGPLRGRSEPMARALSLVRSAQRHGSGGVILVSGPAGIGKSALLGEVCRQAGRMGVRPVVGQCDPIEQVSPGAPVIAALRAGREPLVAIEQYRQILQAAHEPLLLAERIATDLEAAAAAGPVLFAIDDLQWADRVSRFLIRMLVPRLLGLPVVWLLAGWENAEDLLGPDHGHVEDITLVPLTATDLAAVTQDRLGHVPDERTRRFLEASAGNPLLALELLDGLARAAARGDRDTAPAQFNAAIAQRLRDLPEAARDLVALVAVAGRDLPVPDALRLLPSARGLEPDGALAQAFDSGLIELHDEALAPRHDLVREAVCAALPTPTVRALHRRFAQLHLDEGHALAAAPHARAAAIAGDVPSALILITAAEQLVTPSPEDAGDLAALAFRTVRPEQIEWLEIGRRCLAVLCRTQRAGDALAVADQILARVEDGDLVGAVEGEAAWALWLSGQLGQLLSRIEPLLSAGRLDQAVAARLTSARALANTRLLGGQDAAAGAARALDLARACGDPDALALALHACGEAARNEGRHRDALHAFRELRLLAGPHQLAEEITTLQFLDRYKHAQLLLDEVWAEHGDTTSAILPALHCARLWQDFNLGRSGEAVTDAHTLLELGRQLNNHVYALDAVIAEASVALLRGQTQDAAALVDSAERLIDADADVRRPGLTVLAGWVAASQGDLSRALDLLRPVAEGASSSCNYWPLWPCWMGLFFEIGIAGQDGSFANVVVRVAELAAERNPGVASFEGVALSLRGRSKGDLPMIARSAQILARSPRPILSGFGADTYGRALLADGQKAAALEQLDRAWDDYHRMDARVYRAEVECIMRQAGARRAKWAVARNRPDTGWTSLTEAERRVALLIADGHSNRSAAAELGVSVNTVGTHLRAVFAKLDVQSRVQLANTLRGAEPALTSDRPGSAG
ncbi:MULTISPECIES: helix-turn-helix transcriptional regulator [Streptomyces]|nr:MULTISPECIES: AAA family ATPase [Streptomyces]